MAGLRSVGTIGKLTARTPAGVVPKPPPPAKTQGRPLPNLSMLVKAPRGPLLLGLGRKRPHGAGGPGEQPVDFPGSGAEWVWFWASRKYFYPEDHLDPRQGPYDGGTSWVFQSAENPANPRAAGGSIADFVYTQGGANIIVRIEGFYDHIERGGAAQQARDMFLITHAGGAGDRVERVSDGEFMEDVTGAAAVRLLADILAGRSRVSELHGGTIEAPRYANYLLGTR